MTTLRHTAAAHQQHATLTNPPLSAITSSFSTIRASPSTEMLSSDAYSEEINPNVEFLSGKGFWSFYILFLFSIYIVVGLCINTLWPSQKNDKYILTTVNIAHTCITFIIVHWVKGTPFWIPTSQGRYDRDTFWEQIDDGRQYTTTRKILTLIPVLLFLLACYNVKWEFIPVVVNMFALGFAIVPKHAALDHVRIFGINKD